MHKLICFVLLYVFTYALAVQFSMIDSLVLVSVDSLYIIPHFFSFVKYFFESFLIFSKFFLSIVPCEMIGYCFAPSRSAYILYHKRFDLSIVFLRFFSICCIGCIIDRHFPFYTYFCTKKQPRLRKKSRLHSVFCIFRGLCR